MPIKSYVLIPKEGQLNSLQSELSTIEGCEVYPAENKDVLILVTESENEQSDKSLFQQIQESQHLAHITLVSGFEDNKVAHE